MAVFAGPIFPEWYWGPIFFVVLGGPLLVLAALAIDFGVGRWLRSLSWPQRVGLYGVVVAGPLLIYTWHALPPEPRFPPRPVGRAVSLDFTPYLPAALPAAFSEREIATSDAFGGPVLHSRYGVGAGYAFAYEQRPAGTALADGRCELGRLMDAGGKFADQPCRRSRTRRGRTVFLGRSRAVADGGSAYALLGGTLVRLEHVKVADKDVLAYFDSLRAVSRAELEREVRG